MAIQARTEISPATAVSVRQARVVQIRPEGEKTTCLLSYGSPVLVSNVLAAHIRPGDDIRFPLSLESDGAGTEVYVGKAASSARNHDVYQAPIGYAAQPKNDKRGEPYVRAEVALRRLGISALHFACDVLRDRFYVADRRLPWEKQKNFYEILRVPPTASPAELRLAFKLRELELHAEGAPKTAVAAAERAFNILACPELRSCYESLLSNPLAPVLFPYGGFGSVVALGDRSRDGQTFFVWRIVSYLPDSTQRRFHAPLRNVDFHHDHAVYRDSRRKLEVWLDQSAMPVVWDATWNQWKHLLGAKIEVKGTFVESGKYRHRGGEWRLLKRETALPSRLEVKLPTDIAERVETARTMYHRFGQFSDALERIRARIEREPVEREELAAGLRSLLLQSALPAGGAALPVSRGVHLRPRQHDRRRDTPTGARNLSLREAAQHGGLSRGLYPSD